MTTPARKTVWTFIQVVYVLSSVLQFPVARGTLQPDGTISLYRNSQQTFTCNVTGIAAVWTITGLSGISVTGNIGLLAANNNPRITTTDTSGITASSTITISGFTVADNRGTIQCINLADGKVQGKATISIVALTPGDSVSIYKGKQQTFTCSVAGAAVWTITGLRGITAKKSTGLLIANNNARITTTDASGITPSSTITITGFTTADNGGTIQCIELADNSVQGMATISIDSLTPDGIVQVYCGNSQTFICTAPGKPLGLTITGLSGINIPGPFRPRIVVVNNINPRITNALTPDGIVPVYCGSTQTFTCKAPRKPLGWTITGLRGINIPGPFRARPVAVNNTKDRIASNDTGGNKQVGVSVITISGFSAADNGGTIQCINMEDGSVQAMATISIESPLVAFDQAGRNITILEGGRAIFTCKPKVGLISWSLTSAEGVHTEVNSNHPNVAGSSGLFLSPDRTQLLITGVRNSLNGTRVECSPANANAIITSKCKESAYISVQSTGFTTVSPTLVLKITLPSQLAAVLVWSVPAAVADGIDSFVISVAMVTLNTPKTIQQTTVGKQVRAFTVDFPEKGASYQVTVYMTMNGSRSSPLNVEVNF